MPAPHRKPKSPRRNAADIAFHLRNAVISLERLERHPSVGQQAKLVAEVRWALDAAERRVGALQATYPHPHGGDGA